MTCGKSARVDHIQAERLKDGGDHITTVLTTICNKIWHTKMWPEQWTKSIVIPIPKKGDIQLCKSYRTISLISHPSKVMLKILLNRLQPKAKFILTEEQAGFRTGFQSPCIISKYLQHQKDLFHAFIDFKKAFEMVPHNALWTTMRQFNMGSQLIGVIKQLYINAKSAVCMEGRLGEWYHVRCGVRQGCLLSPTLFNIFLERIMIEALENHTGTVGIGRWNMMNLSFANDIDGLVGSEDELRQLLKHLEDTSQSYGMLINGSNTQVMSNTTDGFTDEITINGQTLEEVESFKYLRSIF